MGEKTVLGNNAMILDYINSKNIFKLYSRNICLQINEVFFKYSMAELKKNRGITFSSLSINKNGFVDCYGQTDEADAVSEKIKKIYEKSKSIKDFYEDHALQSFNEYIEFTKRMNMKYSDKYKKISVDEIRGDYDKFSKVNAKFISNLWFIYLSDSPIDKMLKDVLSKYLEGINKKQDMQAYLTLISTTLKKPAIIRQHKELLEIALIEDDEKRQIEIEKHCKKWNWFPCYNPCDDTYELAHYTHQLKQYTPVVAEKELAKIKKEEKEHVDQYDNFLKSIKDEKLHKLVKMTNDICFYREHRNDLRREGLCLIRPLYEKIGMILGLNVKEVCYLTKDEIEISLKNEEINISKEDINNRISEYILFTKNENFILISSRDTISRIKKIIQNKDSEDDFLKGSSAAGGFVIGKVFVINSIDKLKNFKEGEILVTSMTAPDYVMAMKKASAIITDEGGITCHAAIIARELKKPCIIGTKIATQVLHDGDLVEVDADQGIVRILK
jgi:phosphoenolpyruvate synthase/pyruvate phosphate dikinase